MLCMSFRCFVYALPLSLLGWWAVITFCIAISARYLFT